MCPIEISTGKVKAGLTHFIFLLVEKFGGAKRERTADLYNGTVPFLTCVGDGWKNSKQKEEFHQKYKDALEDEHEDFEDVDEWLSKQGFTEKESMYYIEDGVTVELMTGDDELDPIVSQRRKR